MVRSTGRLAYAGRALPRGRTVTEWRAGGTVQPAGPGPGTVTGNRPRPRPVAEAPSPIVILGPAAPCTAPVTGNRPGPRPVAETPSSIVILVPSAAGITTGWAGDMVAASDRVGAGTGMSAISALSALASVRQSKTFGWAVLSAP